MNNAKMADEIYSSLPEEVRSEYKKEYTKQQFVEAFDALKTVFDEIASVIQVVANEIAKTVKRIMQEFPNKRVVYLAVFGKKKRTRKKNMHRIYKWLNRK